MQTKTGIYQAVGFSQFCDAFWDTYKGNFSHKGKRALFDYLEEYSESTGEIVELDIVALYCEYSEYDSATDCIEDCGYKIEYNLEGTDEQDQESEKEKQALEYLEDHTQVIPLEGGGVIIQQF